MKKFGFGKKLLAASVIFGGTIATTATDLFADTSCCYNIKIKPSNLVGVPFVPEIVGANSYPRCPQPPPSQVITAVTFSTTVANAGPNVQLQASYNPSDPNSTQITIGSCPVETIPKKHISLRDMLAATVDSRDTQPLLSVVSKEAPKVTPSSVTAEPLTLNAQ